MKLFKKIIFFICLIAIVGCSASRIQNEITNEFDENFNEITFEFDGNLETSFLKLVNNSKNYAVSPLSIKTALKILEDSSEGDTRDQITTLIKDFEPLSITNDKKISLANGLFLRDAYSKNVKDSYIEMLKNKYNSDLVIDSFKNPDVINEWVKTNTFDMIDNAFSDVSHNDFIIVNTLAFDLEWINTLQRDLYFRPQHTTSLVENYDYDFIGPHKLSFENIDNSVNGLTFACVANKYDLINEIGEKNIKETVYNAYLEWYNNYVNKDEYFYNYNPEPKEYIKEYIKNIKDDEYGFGFYEASTDFSYYVDDDVKVFAKDLTEHNGVNLQYVAIMPIKDTLDSYIDKMSFEDFDLYISKLNTPSYDQFEDGYVTEITGTMPEFSFDSSLDLKKILPSMNVTDIFDSNKALLTKISDSKPFISDFSHKVNITLSNEGIKAAALTAEGGVGAGAPDFDYLYDLPTIKIDLTFNKPFLFLIRDKETNNIWFEGAIYEPTPYDDNYWLY